MNTVVIRKKGKQPKKFTVVSKDKRPTYTILYVEQK
jgi:hypothetical protein